MTTITYCTRYITDITRYNTDITRYNTEMKEDIMTMTIPESYYMIPATDAHGNMTGFTARRWFDREDVHHERFTTPVAPTDQLHLMWEVEGLGWRILARTGMALTLAAPADARREFPEDAYF